MKNENTMRKTIKNIIGVIIVVGLVSWLGYEISTMREEVAKGMAWMSGFI